MTERLSEAEQWEMIRTDIGGLYFGEAGWLIGLVGLEVAASPLLIATIALWSASAARFYWLSYQRDQTTDEGLRSDITRQMDAVANLSSPGQWIANFAGYTLKDYTGDAGSFTKAFGPLIDLATGSASGEIKDAWIAAEGFSAQASSYVNDVASWIRQIPTSSDSTSGSSGSKLPSRPGYQNGYPQATMGPDYSGFHTSYGDGPGSSDIQYSISTGSESGGSGSYNAPGSGEMSPGPTSAPPEPVDAPEAPIENPSGGSYGGASSGQGYSSGTTTTTTSPPPAEDDPGGE